MSQTVHFSNIVPDYYTKLPIEKEDSIQFFTGWVEGNLSVSHTQQAHAFEKVAKTGVFAPHIFGYMVNMDVIPDMIKSGYYSFGKYNKQCLYHVQTQGLDTPVTYKKFENTHGIVCCGLNDEATLKREFNQNAAMGVISPTNRILEGHDYTYGVEIETSHGKVSKFKDLNVSCVYDGSLKDENGNCYGGEYVTGVLKGDMGMIHLKKLSQRLVESNCGVNHKCSIHVHIGNINWSAEQIVLAWSLGCQLEDELFSMMPHSRRTNEFCQLLKKKHNMVIDYKALKNLSKYDEEIVTRKAYNTLYSLIVSGTHDMPNRSCNKMSNHPEGAKQRYNHNAQRYCWLNFVPLVFNIRNNPKARTLEFRCHSSTLNYKKIENWLKICVAFVNVIDNHTKLYKQGKIRTLSDVVTLAYPKTGEALNQYIAERKKKFLHKKDASASEQDEYNEVIKLGDGSIKEVVCV